MLLEPGDAVPSVKDWTSSSLRADKLFGIFITVNNKCVSFEYAQIDLQHTRRSSKPRYLALVFTKLCSKIEAL